MANYTPTFTKPYPSGWVDKPSKTTPATAAIMNSYDTAIAALEAYLRDNAIKNVSASTTVKSGTKTATITIDGTEYVIYSPSVSYESTITGGTKVGTITVGTNTFDVYAPTSSAGGSTVSVVPKTLTGTNIAEITVDGTTYQLYAPTSGGSGSIVTAEATLAEGTQIGKITIDGTETILYAPTASPITVDSELSATSENAIQNKAVDAAVKNLQQQIDAGGTGGSITVDSALSTTSENPVQNKVVTAELNKKIETLDDEYQAPDVVNFDLDSELSLTSVKGVQNKAIAEEFQKYANGTKVVAKATEANTATTASNAEKVNGHTVGADVPNNAVFTDTVYDDSAVKASIQNIVNGTTQVGSATKATQDAQGNIINETYAKKTEVPQGTVVDNTLSSTSENPVQNKVVKAEFDQVNSNLDALEFGEVAGGNNLFEDEIKWMENITVTRGTKSVSDGKITLTATSNDCFTDREGDVWKNNGINTIPCKPNTTYTLSWEYEGDSVGSVYAFENGSTNNMSNTPNNSPKLLITTSADAEYLTFRVGVSYQGTSITYWNFQLEEGDTATPYEPYIPSVAMLADENAQQNIEMLDTKMLGWSVPKKCPVQNYVDSDGVFHQRVGRVDLGSLSWTSMSSNRLSAIFEGYKKVANSVKPSAYTNKYSVVNRDNSTVDKSFTLYSSSDGNDGVIICDSSYTDADTFKNAMQGVYLYYELAEEKTIAVDGNEAISSLKNDLSNLKDGTTPVAKAVADEEGNNIKSTYAKKTEAFETVTEDVNVVLNSDLFDSTYSDITCIRIGKLCVLSFTIHVPAQKYISSTIDEIVLMTIVGTKYRPKKPDVNSPRQTFQGFAVGNYDENGTQSQSLNNTVRIITSSDNNYTEIITRDKDRINWSGYVQGQIMWVTD